MFEDLNGANNSNLPNTNQPVSPSLNGTNSLNPLKPPVDDIFAETDGAVKGGGNQEIVARRVGLGATTRLTDPVSNEEEKSGGNKGFLIAAIVMGVIILGLVGFLVYNKFFKVAPVDTGSDSALTTETNTSTDAAIVAENNVEPIKDDSAVDFVPIVPGGDIETDNKATSSEELVEELPTEPVIVRDSDGDDLNDEEEAYYGTNPLKIDSDDDGLNDYEEIMIYKTNPLLADTDGDGYLDGAEVSGGYDPNVVGGAKLPGNVN